MRGVIYEDDRLAVVDDLEVRDLRPDEVRVAIRAAGVCHSDVSVIDGTIPFPQPVVLGHEGAGVVEAVGDAVSGIEVGDHVVLTTLGNCGHCDKCDSGRPTHCRQTIGKIHRPFTRGGQKVFQFANTGVFTESTVVKANQAVPISKDVPFEVASLIGCGVITGVGAVFNRARVTHGQSVVVIGVGGIGLNVIQGARLSDAIPVIAVDTNPRKEELARQFGATHFVNAAEVDDTVAAVKEICPDGVDVSFECVGAAPLIRQAVDMLDVGGTCVMLGVPKFGTEASFQVSDMYVDKTIMGCRYGSARPHHDIPLLVDLYLAGRLELDALVTRTYPLEDIQRTLDDMHGGELARGVLTL
ncbi:MAG: Zn-dependent alcohol dehydrogenase [Acidimicrobiia bacterium]|nr:Zn-dependent alcohol dehydrogenase [Acidimicrobiia bacterium]